MEKAAKLILQQALQPKFLSLVEVYTNIKLNYQRSQKIQVKLVSCLKPFN